MAISSPSVASLRGATTRDGVVFTYSSPQFSAFQRMMIRAIERAGGQRKLRRLYDEQVAGRWDESADFFALAVAALGLDIRYDAAALNKVPRDGPVLFVANHPYGVLDGIVLTWLTGLVRDDVKVLAHSVLCQAPGAQKKLLPIDFDGTPAAVRTTLKSRMTAQRWLKEGHAVGIFPAGGVSTSTRAFAGPACDPPWHPFTVKLLKGSKATVVPVFFAGQNSRLFQIASHVSYTWRLSLLFRETVRRIGTPLDIFIGEPIPYEDLPIEEERAVLVKELRRRTYALAQSQPKRCRPAPDREFHYPKHFKF